MILSERVLGERASTDVVCVREAEGLVGCAIVMVRKMVSSFCYIETISHANIEQKMVVIRNFLCKLLTDGIYR